jgi:NADH-quinone oxidoreductase subunit C
MTVHALLDTLKNRFPDAVKGSHSYRGDATIVIGSEWLLQVCRALKDDPAFQMNLLVDLTAVDFSTFNEARPAGLFASSGVSAHPTPEIPDATPWPGPTSARFAVVYHFYSMAIKHRLRVLAPLESDDPEIDSLSSLWAGADWLEREVWDMFGIRFRGHQNLKRILMYEEFVGHPLRKDYPVNKRQPLIGPVN